MGFREFFRGTTAADDEARSLPPAENQLPLHGGYTLGDAPLGPVTTGNVLKIADAYACVRVLADSISTLPLKVYRRLPAGRVPAGDDARAVQLLTRPSPGSTTVDLVSQIVVHLNVLGDCFLGKYRADNEIVQLAPIHPDRVQVELRGQTCTYILDGRTEHGPSDILHIRAMSMDGLRGMSPVTSCRTALGLNESLRESGRQFFTQGSRPSGVMTLPPGMSNDEIAVAREVFQNRHAGVEKMHQVLVLDGEAKFTPVSFTADDAQFIQSREVSTREIARIFRVPSWAIDGDTGGSLTYSNVGEQARALVVYSLRPWIVRIERAISSDPDLCPGGTYVEFELDGLLRGDATQRADVYTKGLDPITGWLQRSEVRRLENLEPEGES